MYFNYFFPGRNHITLDDLIQAGLGYVFGPESGATRQESFAPRQVVNGPGGQHGLIVSLSDTHCGFYKDLQIWKQEVGKDYWVGLWREQRPTPQTLARANLIDGEELQLEDGHLWMIPKARHFEEFDGEILALNALPTSLTRDASGHWVRGEVKARYRRLWQRVSDYFRDVDAAETNDRGEMKITFDYESNLTVEAFKCNYRVSEIELDLLGIYDTEVHKQVIEIVTDLKGWTVLFKKKLITLDTGNFIAGPAG